MGQVLCRQGGHWQLGLQAPLYGIVREHFSNCIENAIQNLPPRTLFFVAYSILVTMNTYVGDPIGTFQEKSIKNIWVTFVFLRKQIQIACTIRKTSGAIISTASAFSTELPALITRNPLPTKMIIIHIFNNHHKQPIPSQGKETQVAVSSVAWTNMWVNHSHTFRQNNSYY